MSSSSLCDQLIRHGTFQVRLSLALGFPVRVHLSVSPEKDKFSGNQWLTVFKVELRFFITVF
jgi:hypothetical protein